MSQKETDLQRIKKLIKIMEDNDLVEIEIAHDNEKILLKRAQPQPPTMTAIPMAAVAGDSVGGAKGSDVSSAGQVAEQDAGLVDIKSPLVGTFYATPSPDSEAFVEVDSPVEPQTVVCVIEAMKVMNEIKAETSGKIARVLVKSGQAVEYGQVLFKLLKYLPRNGYKAVNMTEEEAVIDVLFSSRHPHMAGIDEFDRSPRKTFCNTGG